MRKLLVGKKFQDTVDDDDPAYFGGKKIITDVVYKRGEIKKGNKTLSSFYQPFVVYGPEIKTKRHTYQIDDASGEMIIPVPEVLHLYFPELKKKYKEGCNVWKKKNKFNENYDYGKGTKR